MDNLPIVRVHIEKMKEEIVNAFVLQNAQITVYIKDALDKICTEEYVKALVERNIQEIVPEIMADVFRDYEIRRNIRDKDRVVSAISCGIVIFVNNDHWLILTVWLSTTDI